MLVNMFHSGLLGMVSPCLKENSPGPSVVPAAKLCPIAGRQPCTYETWEMVSLPICLNGVVAR